jgi:hypothetical protein
VIITSEPSSSSLSTMAGSDGNPPANDSNHQTGERKTRFEVRHLDEKELMIDTNAEEQNHHRPSDMISSFRPETGQTATTTASTTISTTTTRVHQPLSQQSRFSPGSNTSPNSLSSLQSAYETTPALLTTTTTNFSGTSNHLLRSDGLPSRNPSIKSTGYADGGASARIRSLRRRISHTLLFLPEQRRVSTASAVR